WPLGALLLAWTAWSAIALWRDRRDLEALGHQNLVLSPGTAWARRWAKGTFLILALGAAGLGAARLQGGLVPQDWTARGSDLVVVLDVSKSMLTQDVKPSRLDAAKKALEDWLGGLQGDRVGLVVFSGQALVQVPLTLDLDAVSQILDKADTDMVALGGTDLGAGIQTALSAFPKDPKRGKAILLLTDGETTDGTSNVGEACQEAVSQKVPIITVGMGTPQGQPIPDGMGFWGQPSYKQDASGQVHISHLDEGTLRRIAQQTGGVYLQGDSAEALTKIQGTVERLSQTDLAAKGGLKREELSPLCALAAAACLLLSSIL
ncbi:MAG TPA: VWA domain-containing protein, partial [bacterium]|nr:VWA domain-containing protein [bacterium]